jgi:aminopeptidase C
MNDCPIKFKHATNRSTKAYKIVLSGHSGSHVLFISYETIIGPSNSHGAWRVENSWGPTTGRHMRGMGLTSDDFQVVDKEELNDRVKMAIEDVVLPNNIPAYKEG